MAEIVEEEEDAMNFLNELAWNNYIRTQEIFDLIGFPKRKYTVHERINSFSRYDESEFRGRYRMSKANVERLYYLLDGPNTLEPMVS